MKPSFARPDDATRSQADGARRNLMPYTTIGESFASPRPFTRKRKGSKRFAAASNRTQDSTHPLAEGIDFWDLADVAQCSESLLSKIENGRANPSLKMIYRIASALGTPVAGLFQLGGDSEDIVLRRGQRPVVETDQVRRGNGVQLEAVIPAASGHLLSGYINHIEPGGGSEGLI